MTLLAADDVSVRLGGRTILQNVSFSIDRAEQVTIVGPNGSGKSTLLRTLIGAILPTRGRVHRAPGINVGYVPQRLGLEANLPLTAERFLNLPVRQPGPRVTEVLEQVQAPGLSGAQMTHLSGGEFQRVLLARALLCRPDILILDEPTQSLDQPGIASFYKLISDVQSDLGCAVLMVSHDLHVVMRSADRVICLNGHVCCQGTPTAVSASPEYRALFGGQFALYEHHHDHSHDHSHDHGHEHGHDHAPIAGRSQRHPDGPNA